MFIDYLAKEKEEPAIAFEGRNHKKKTATNEEEKGALSSRQCAVSQVGHNDSKTPWIALRIFSVPSLFSVSGP